MIISEVNVTRSEPELTDTERQKQNKCMFSLQRSSEYCLKPNPSLRRSVAPKGFNVNDPMRRKLDLRGGFGLRGQTIWDPFIYLYIMYLSHQSSFILL